MSVVFPATSVTGGSSVACEPRIRMYRVLQNRMRWENCRRDRIDELQAMWALHSYFDRCRRSGEWRSIDRHSEQFSTVVDAYAHGSRAERTMLNRIMCELMGHPRRVWHISRPAYSYSPIGASPTSTSTSTSVSRKLSAEEWFCGSTTDNN